VNLQTIPRELKVVKECFVPKYDMFIFADYQSIEMRLLAYYLFRTVKDESLVYEFENGIDPHTETASMLGVSRHEGKTLNFSIVYGGGAPTIMRQLDYSYNDAKRLLRKFHAARPGLKVLTEVAKSEFQKRGYVKTVNGRRVRPPSEHKVLNYIVQGSAAELIKDAILYSYKDLRNAVSKLVLAVHDELVWDVTNGEFNEMCVHIPTWMRNNEKILQVIDTPVSISTTTTSWADKNELQT